MSSTEEQWESLTSVQFGQSNNSVPLVQSHTGNSESPQRTSVNSISESPPKRKPGRKGHTKSRTGCLNCKKARIKCKENKPSCDYCAHRDLQCQWPELQIHQQNPQGGNLAIRSAQRAQRASSTSSSSSTAQSASTMQLSPTIISTPGPVFNMQDFRLFDYFTKKAYPHQPIGNDKVWRHEIPCLASDYDYLLHSMLALSASELNKVVDPSPEMLSIALSHRVKAITSLNKAISQGINIYEEGNAMIAACYSLLFQSCLLEDGLMEYMMFIRGTVSIGWSMGMRGMKFVFEKFFDEEQLKQVDPDMKTAPLVRADVVAACCRSFERFQTLCVKKVEIDVYTVLVRIARTLVTSSWEAYLELRNMYTLFSYHMTQPEFEQYCDKSSFICQLLQAHFVALQLIMAPVTTSELNSKKAEVGSLDTESKGTALWLTGIHRRVPNHLASYFSWTMWVEQETVCGRLNEVTMNNETYVDKISDVEMNAN